MQHTETIKIDQYQIVKLLNLARNTPGKEVELEYTTNLDNDNKPIIAIYNPGGYGNDNLLGFVETTVIKNGRSGNKIYAMCEAIADIALQVGNAKFISVDSRLVNSLIIRWAKEFETINAAAEWGVNTELDYIEAIEQFTDIKIRDAIANEFGYIDTDTL